MKNGGHIATGGIARPKKNAGLEEEDLVCTGNFGGEGLGSSRSHRRAKRVSQAIVHVRVHSHFSIRPAMLPEAAALVAASRRQNPYKRRPTFYRVEPTAS